MVKQFFLLVAMALMICSLPMASAIQGKLTYGLSKRNHSLNLVSPPGATCIILKLPTWYIINDTSASITTFGDANCQEVLRIITPGEEWETQMSDEPVVAIVFHRER
jgi:hypothetical protein